jgi:hypothetical protein
MTAKTSSINGVTRQREFEIDITTFQRHGSRMCASAEASTLGFKPGEFPDWFDVPSAAMFDRFMLHEVDKDGSHFYSDGRGNWFTIFND